LWFNFLIGSCFLLPFPTWQQLVDFLSSVVVFAYLSGPVTFMVLRQELPNIPRMFRVSNYKLVGYLGFICCSLLIYWSGLNNLMYLFIAMIIIITIYGLIINNSVGIFKTLFANAYMLSYLLLMIAVSYLHKMNLVSFPIDNIFIIIIGIIACRVFISVKENVNTINNNILQYSKEL
jgi:hypothetical protein